MEPFNKNLKELEELDSFKNLTIKERNEQLISKRKEFIQNYRKKQRILSLIESKNYENLNYKNNNQYKQIITMNNIEDEPDPISRIILLKVFLQSNPSKINTDFIKNNLKLLKNIFSDFKKVLFNYENKNIEKQIYMNKSIIYCYLSLLLDPESNPLIEEFDFEFLSSINTFSLYYLMIENDKNFSQRKNIFILQLYILLLINNLIRIYPDVELIKATIEIKNCIIIVYNKYFNFNFVNNKINLNNQKENLNLETCEHIYEFFEFSLLKLIENCVLYLYLKDNETKELIDMILHLIYYYYSKNDIKLLIYSLETLINTKKAYLLLNDENYNKFLLDELDKIIISFNDKDKSEVTLIMIKHFFELYLEELLFILEYNNVIKPSINCISFFQEKIIIFFKNVYFGFYHDISKISSNKINTNELKLITKTSKIFNMYFKLINSTNLQFITLEQKIQFQNILCSYFISKNDNNSSLCDILINIIIHLIESQEKNSMKICNLIISIFNCIYSFDDFEYRKEEEILGLKGFQLFLIEEYNLHMKLFPYLNIEKYYFLVENLLELLNKLLFFCGQIDINEKRKNSLLEKIKRELYDLNVFEEVENIEYNTINSNIKFSAQQIRDIYLI